MIMREVEKMAVIREKLESVDQKVMDKALEVIGDTFKAMVTSAEDYILNTKEKKIQFEDAQMALNTVKELAAKAGEEMPDFDTDEKVKAYIMKYGMEIVKTR